MVRTSLAYTASYGSYRSPPKRHSQFCISRSMRRPTATEVNQFIDIYPSISNDGSENEIIVNRSCHTLASHSNRALATPMQINAAEIRQLRVSRKVIIPASTNSRQARTMIHSLGVMPAFSQQRKSCSSPDHKCSAGRFPSHSHLD